MEDSERGRDNREKESRRRETSGGGEQKEGEIEKRREGS